MNYNWSQKNVLVVEDTPINIEIMKMMLKKTKINMFVAKDGDEFFQKLEERNYDLVLMDIGLPGQLNGYDLIKYMHKNDIKIPIIIQSANFGFLHEMNDIHEDYVEKPINFDVLFDKMNNHFNKN